MIGEFERPGRRRAAQDRALARYLRDTVAPYSPYYSERLKPTPPTSVEQLATLPLTRLEDIGDPAALVLRPTAERIATSGDTALKARLRIAQATRRVTAINREIIEPAYKPIHWHLTPLPLGYTAEDLDRLAEVGRTSLEMAGVQPDDVLVSLQPPAPELGFWQLALGARRAGIPSLLLGAATEPEELAPLRPNVLAGSAGDLLRVLELGRASGLSFAALHTILAIGEPLDPVERSRLAELAGGGSTAAAVVASWAPPGVRALWSECRDGVDAHTWPAFEVLELVDPITGGPLPPGTGGEVVYTPLGWKGSVVLRLRTDVFGSLDDAPCVSCGRTSPRLRLVPFLPPFARILDEHSEVDLWQAELRHGGGSEELIVFVTPRVSGHPGRLLRDLDRQLSATQFVVLDRASMLARLRAHGDARVVDIRS